MALVITGMHRSGTSAVARIVSGIGLVTGDGGLMETIPENPRGFFERVDVVDFNDRWLAQLGGAWDAPPRAHRADFARLSDGLFHDARSQLDLFAADSRNWYVKDPRIALILPVWDRLCLRSVPVVLVVRSPREVATSLRLRNSFSSRLSLSLWLTYTNEVLRASSLRNVLVVDHNRMLTEPLATVKNLQEFISKVNDVPLPSTDPVALSELVEPELRRQREPELDRFGGIMVDDLTELYEGLAEISGEDLADQVKPMPLPDWAEETLADATELFRAKGDDQVQRAWRERDAMEQELVTLQKRLLPITTSRGYQYLRKAKGMFRDLGAKSKQR